MTKQYDLLIVGGGKAGKSMAMERAAKGYKVALVEERYLGGTCINVACIPTKTLISTARLMWDARSASSRGVINTEDAEIDLNLLREHKNTLVGNLAKAHLNMFTESSMDFFEGHTEFLDANTVRVQLISDVPAVGSKYSGADFTGESIELSAEKIIINTGTRPARPAITGLWELNAAAEAAGKIGPVWTSEELLLLPEVPQKLAIIGAGYIGVESAWLMASLGSKVTLIASGAQILPNEDPAAAEKLQKALEAAGVTVVLNARAESAVAGEGGKVSLNLNNGESITANTVLVAAGRTPNTDQLALENTGVKIDERGFIAVDEHLRTSVEGIFAAGDVAGSPMFTHASWNDFRIIRAQLDGASLISPEASKTGRLMPYTVFTTPELARIGINETQAEQLAQSEGLEYRVAKIPTANIPRAKTLGKTAGYWQAIVDAKSKQILGATLIGHESGEVITALHLAMVGGLTYEQVRFQAIAHPTMCEGLNLLFDALG